MAPVWKTCVRPDPELPDIAQGYVRAESADEALALIGHPAALAFPCADEGALAPGEALCWIYGGARMDRLKAQAGESPHELCPQPVEPGRRARLGDRFWHVGVAMPGLAESG